MYFKMSESMLYDDFAFYSRFIVSKVAAYKATNFSELIVWTDDGQVWIYDGIDQTSRCIRTPRRNETYDEAFKHEYGMCLKRILFFKGITQNELAERVGTTQATISHYCKGIRMPTVPSAIKIASALECTLDDFTYTFNSKGEPLCQY